MNAQLQGSILTVSNDVPLTMCVLSSPSRLQFWILWVSVTCQRPSNLSTTAYGSFASTAQISPCSLS